MAEHGSNYRYFECQKTVLFGAILLISRHINNQTNMPKAVERSIERLNHFRCIDCNKWWSIGDAPIEKVEWYCPWCGKKGKYEAK